MTWRRYKRRGSVTARRLTAEHWWRTHAGDPLVAQQGDWLLTEATDSWTITDDEFRDSYTQVDGDLYRRTGAVEARSGRTGEIVQTLEGEVTVRPGDMVVRRRETGAIWVVPNQRFMERYLPDSGAD